MRVDEGSQNLESNYAFESFSSRHIGPRAEEIEAMLKVVGASSLEDLISKTVPSNIRFNATLKLPRAATEVQALAELREIAAKNQIWRSYIGAGFYGTITPGVILRNILENPNWYTQYTPYQAEISQGRMEALLNFQTMITDLTGMQIANASMLDEGSSAAEAMTLCHRIKDTDSKNKFFVANNCHPSTIDVVQGRAEPLGIEIVVGDHHSAKIDASFFGALIQYPGTDGKVEDLSNFANSVHAHDALVVVAADILSLALLTPPGEWGADVVVGNSQRFGVPMGFGGPHAAFMATKEEFKRELPGRLIGVSKDAAGRPAMRLSLQTREQHIRRDKATSNICTAQVLLAVMASMYAVYHGPEGIKAIATKVNRSARRLAHSLAKFNFELANKDFFDTIRIKNPGKLKDLLLRAESKRLNFRTYDDQTLGISVDETTTDQDLNDILSVFSNRESVVSNDIGSESLPSNLQRKSSFLTHKVFNSHRSETEMLRYIKRLESKDLSLAQSMIPLGSCTMKLNATTEMIPVTWAEFGNVHPFAPASQTQGYLEMITQLEGWLSEITGMNAVSLQPNAGSQGEYAGLLAIRGYYKKLNQSHRNICLIPNSAHGTNPASAVMAGMEVVKVLCDSQGNIDVADLKARAIEHSANLAALMMTYPSTHGVFEESVVEIADIIHKHGGQVYMDGANLNAQVGLCRPGDFGVDVCHLNLHKTFCIPHGGGGPGVGPIAVKSHLKPFLPGHFNMQTSGKDSIKPTTSGPWGSASILVIPWAYIRMMGADGLKFATSMAILNANYVANRLEQAFPVLYRGKHGKVAHECILDLRNLKGQIGIEAGDVAKRLMDYGFHAPTVSFPVVETLMVEPTESEPKSELDRFCEAMLLIREEIRAIENGADKNNNVLKNAPHTAEMVAANEWNHPYSREQAAYPTAELRQFKFWPAVRRVDNVYGDRNLFCSCSALS